MDDSQINLQKPVRGKKIGRWSRWSSLLFRLHGKTKRPLAATERTKAQSPSAVHHAKSKADPKKSVNGSNDKNVGQVCLLFEMLPLEIRQEIYAYVLGRDMFRLISVPWKVTTAADIFGNVSMTQAHFDPEGKEKKPPRGIALLQTCRKIYHESINLLYSTNTFVVHDFATMTTFAKSIPARHLNLIRSLRICYSPTTSISYKHRRTKQYDLPTGEGWEEFWEMIASMEGLKILDVQLERYFEFLPEDEEGKKLVEYTTLKPLQRVRGLTHFQLMVAYLHKNPYYQDEAVYAPEYRRQLYALVRRPRVQGRV